MNLNKTIHFIAIMFILTGCKSNQQSVTGSNYAKMYKNGSKALNIEYKIYHTSKDSTTVFFKIDSKFLLYSRTSSSEPYKAQYKIHYELVDTDNKVLLDSNSRIFEDYRNNQADEGDILGQFYITSLNKYNHRLKLSIFDLNRKTEKIYYEQMHSGNGFHIQNFLISDQLNYTFSNNVINKKDSLHIKSAIHKDTHLIVQRYNSDQSIAKSPFNQTTETSTLDIIESDTVKFGGDAKLKLTHKGIYKITGDNDNARSLTLIRFSEGFPRVLSPESLYAPLRYITSKEEFDRIKNNPNPKKAAENFWIARASRKDLAKNTIHEFYNRVEEANTYFTSFKEGWMTDRGMILIIFGPPERVIKQFKRESWYYNTSGPGLVFIFRRQDHPFSDNVYLLDRSASYKGQWYRAVDSWRAGIPYYGR